MTSSARVCTTRLATVVVHVAHRGAGAETPDDLMHGRAGGQPGMGRYTHCSGSSQHRDFPIRYITSTGQTARNA